MQGAQGPWGRRPRSPGPSAVVMRAALGHDGRVNPLRTLFTLVRLGQSEAVEAEQRARLPGVRFGSRVIVRGADRIRAGRDVFIDHGAYLNPSSVNNRRGFITIGDEVEIGPYCVLWGGGGLTIGNGVHLGAYVHLTSQAGGHVDEHFTFGVSVAPVVIEDHALVYSGAIIVPGVRIGRGARVAAGAVVIDDVEPGALVAGVPARALVAARRNAG